MSTDTDWLTRYLDQQAERVVVDDMLYEIEHGITSTPVTDIESRRPRSFSMFVAAAAAVSAIGIGAVVLNNGTGTTPAGQAAAPIGSDGTTVETDPAPTQPTQPTQPTVAAIVTTVNELPPGGMGLAGQTPVCTMVNADVYNCTLQSSYDPAGDAVQPLGLVSPYTDDSLHIAGGCRTTSLDAREWICFVGGRSVVEGTVSPEGVGDFYLGQPAPNEYMAG